ncbi:uncharacterized protein BO95DRAFT_447955 [Aspergillus brunneoviolaceus CBS 621.78]|uniref:Uncharacterized protein n=1 Tax=Aspergillus brunneoviolaceus CBS 621.78 TaxID=1450534 RepID=A0ACD1FTW5_9EURO|nr:hypothetical protein BO95DRAFT_447955 [Aspergillus brunneoviolaceus CBS 621.78]RAH40399.1 hypothetical protein BO95DRAFT_447955 [Aspergillus brunneoviolaceus CBS 621.78]
MDKVWLLLLSLIPHQFGQDPYIDCPIPLPLSQIPTQAVHPNSENSDLMIPAARRPLQWRAEFRAFEYGVGTGLPNGLELLVCVSVCCPASGSTRWEPV